MTRISGIYRMANADPPTGQVAKDRNQAARAALWHKMGIAALDPEDIRNEWLRQAITNEANALYGPRKGQANG